MQNLIESALSFISDFVLSVIAEVTITLLLAAIALTLFGVFIIGFKLVFLLKGQNVNGVVIGAVRNVKVKIKNGEIVKKRLNSGVLFPVFEYTLNDGVSYQTKGSTGGSHVYKYTTGQAVKLTVWPRGSYNDVDDAKSYIAYIFGAILIGAGGFLFCFYMSNFASLNIGVFIWVGAITSIAIRFKDKIAQIINDYKSNKGHLSEVAALKRSFDPEHLHPIEYYIKEQR